MALRCASSLSHEYEPGPATTSLTGSVSHSIVWGGALSCSAGEWEASAGAKGIIPLSGLASGVAAAETSVQARLQLQARNPVARDTTATSAMRRAPRRGLRPLRSRSSTWCPREGVRSEPGPCDCCAAADVEPEAAAEMVSSCCESIMKTCQVGTWAWVNPTGQLSGPPVLSLTTCSVDGVKGLCHPYFWRT